jgi:riboflavin synthase
VFTGIVQGTGMVARAERRGEVLRIEVEVGGLFAGLPLGGSIAVNGCCLTAVSASPEGFAAELTSETLMRTSFESRLRPGVRVNLERPMRADGRFDGHIVQGHVDAVGRVRDLRRAASSADLVVECPASIERYLVEKGSITVDGISLTVAERRPGAFTVAVIPYTLEMTNLGDARAGDLVNLEADVIAKYVERLLADRPR